MSHEKNDPAPIPTLNPKGNAQRLMTCGCCRQQLATHWGRRMAHSLDDVSEVRFDDVSGFCPMCWATFGASFFERVTFKEAYDATSVSEVMAS